MAGSLRRVPQLSCNPTQEMIQGGLLRDHLNDDNLCVHLCRNFWVLIGTASTWFLLDIAFYSQNLFLPNILEGIGYNPKLTLPASKCVKTKTCPHYNLPVSPTPLYLSFSRLHDIIHAQMSLSPCPGRAPAGCQHHFPPSAHLSHSTSVQLQRRLRNQFVKQGS